MRRIALLLAFIVAMTWVTTASAFAPVTFSEFATLPGLDIVAWGDYDQDGDLDLVTGCSGLDLTAYIITQGPVGVFTVSETLTCTKSIRGRSQPWADYDGDGDLDLTIPGRGASFKYRNDSGSFVSDTPTGLPVQSSGGAWFQWGDVDNDGDPDLVIIGVNSGGVFRNNGGGVLSNIQVLDNFDNHSADLGDYDQDGDLDLVVTGKGKSGPGGWRFEVYRNNGSGNFSLALTLPGRAGSATHWVDYDGDGDLDIFVIGNDSTVVVSHAELWRQGPIGTFTLDTTQSTLNAYAALVPGTATHAAWGDYDNDGDPDLIVSGLTAGGPLTRTFRNDPTGTMVADSGTGLDGIAVQYTHPVWGDFDNDGDLDLAARESADGTKIFINSLCPLLEDDDDASEMEGDDDEDEEDDEVENEDEDLEICPELEGDDDEVEEEDDD